MPAPADFSFGPFEPRVGRSVSLGQAAVMLHVSIRTVYYWIREGRLRTIRTLNGSQRVLVDSIRESACGTSESRGAVSSTSSSELRRMS
jgi:excisionase family DNA binding protein